MSATTKRVFISASIAFIVATAAFSYTLYKVHSKEQTLQTQLNTVGEQMKKEDAYNMLERQAQESKSDREQLSTFFLEGESDSITILNWIEKTAPELGLFIETKGLQKITDKDTQTDWVEASFSFSGDRANVERFLAVLERLPYVSYVTSASLTARSADNWEALVTLRVYLQKV